MYRPENENENKSLRAFNEVMVILVLIVALMIINKQIAVIASLFPILYFIVEGKKRNRNNSRTNTLLLDLKESWYWILLVAIGFQTLDVVVFTNLFPEMTTHIKDRAPIVENNMGIELILTFLIAALGEEIMFRGLVQDRLGWYLKPWMAILLTSVIFALMHLSSGSPLIVGLDITSVFLDSVVFGIIYYKTKNVIVSWIAHAAANIIAFLYMAYLI